MKRVLVCGVTGFVGRNIAERLSKNPEYIIYGVYHKKKPFESDKIKFIQGDLRNPEDVERLLDSMDVVIQAAATTSGSKDIISMPYIHVTDNAVMNSLIFRQAYASNVKHVIFFSCGVMYQPGDMPRKETDFNESEKMVDAYFGVGWTKVYIEKMCEFYSKLGGTKYTVLRQSNIYGPYDKYDFEHSHMFGANIRKVMDAEEGQDVIVWGEGKESRDLLYIDDVVDFVDTAIKKQKENFFICNVSYGKAYSVREIVEKIIEISEKKIGIKFDSSKPTIPTKLALDNSRAEEVFGWKPKTSLEEGIRKTISWYGRYYKDGFDIN